MEFKHVLLMDAIAEPSMPVITHFDSQGMSNLAWACAQLCALNGAAGYAHIAAKHLGAADAASTASTAEETTKAEDKEALKDLQAKDPIQEVKEEKQADRKAIKPAMHPLVGGEHTLPPRSPQAAKKTLKKIRSAIDSEGSEDHKISKVKDALEDHTVQDAKGITKKMLGDLQQRNDREAKRLEHPTPARGADRSDLDAVKATAKAARAASESEAVAAEKADGATEHLKAQLLQKEVAGISEAGKSVDKDMITTLKKEVKHEEAKLHVKKGFTKTEIDDSKMTAVAAKKASDALHGSWGYADTAVGSERMGSEEAAAAAKAAKGRSYKGPKIEIPDVIKPEAVPKKGSFSAPKKASDAEKEEKTEQKKEEKSEKSEAKSEAKKDIEKKKTSRIREVIDGQGSEQDKLREIRSIVHAAKAAEASHPKAGNRDFMNKHRQHLKDVQDKLAASKKKISAMEAERRMRAATKTVQEEAVKEVKKATSNVQKHAMTHGLKEARAAHLAKDAVAKAAKNHAAPLHNVM